MPRVLAVTAAALERDAVLQGRPSTARTVDGVEVTRAVVAETVLDVVVAGVGVAAAAVATAHLVRYGYDLVVSAGIAGGFGPATPGTVVVAESVVHADLGAQTGSGFVSMAELGFSPVRFALDPGLTNRLARTTGALTGAVLSVSTVTGTAERAEELRRAHPDAVAEAMEGVGVYLAASRAGVPFAEVRTISNRVGPRDTEQWQIGSALKSLTAAFYAVLHDPSPIPTLEETR